jgi:hypothetical protein
VAKRDCNKKLIRSDCITGIAAQEVEKVSLALKLIHYGEMSSVMNMGKN